VALKRKSEIKFCFTESDESKEILDRAADLLCPSLRDAEVVSDWIGLRPFREGGVRLERQDLDLDGGEKLKVWISLFSVEG
jgi:hypothetical protein